MNKSMNPESASKQSTPEHPFAVQQSRWKIWLVRVGVFSLMLFGLISAFSFLGSIVERFFIALYTD